MGTHIPGAPSGRPVRAEGRAHVDPAFPPSLVDDELLATLNVDADKTGMRVRPIDPDTAMAFVGPTGASVFNLDPESDMAMSTDHPGQTSFLARHVALCGFEHEGALVGVFAIQQTGAAQAYLRTFVIRAPHRGRMSPRAFMTALKTSLQAKHIQSLRLHTATTNLRTLILLLRLGFVITGVQLSERYGYLLELALFMDDESRRRFEHSFCATPRA